MSTTLTNGLKLPDKGSVDWYADMQNNYAILDGAVGTVAEHTSALSGKAPLVHTHSKADITDLFNSANTWDGENNFNHANLNRKYNFTLGDNSYQISRIQYQDKDSTRWGVLSFIHNTNNSVYCDIGVNCLKNDGQTVLNKSIRFLIQPDNNSEFKPINDKAIDLGSSSNQWKSVYAQSYYYNGVAWGLDKENTWTADNTFSNSIVYFKLGSSGSYNDIRWKDNNDSNYATLRSKTNTISLGLRYASASAWYDGSSININNDGSVNIKSYDGTENWTVNFTPVGIYPTSNNALELGTSTNKWKTLNGINPGALSLPDVSDGDPISTIGWSLTGARNTYTPTENGWFFIRVKGTASAKCSLNIHSGSYNDNYPTWVSYNDPTISLSTSLVVPAQKTVNLYVYIIAAEIEQLIFFPCLGNV